MGMWIGAAGGVPPDTGVHLHCVTEALFPQTRGPTKAVGARSTEYSVKRTLDFRNSAEIGAIRRVQNGASG